MVSTPCPQCGGSGQTNYGGFPNICVSCNGGGLIRHGPRGPQGGSGGGSAIGALFLLPFTLLKYAVILAALFAFWPFLLIFWLTKKK